MHHGCHAHCCTPCAQPLCSAVSLVYPAPSARRATTNICISSPRTTARCGTTTCCQAPLAAEEPPTLAPSYPTSPPSVPVLNEAPSSPCTCVLQPASRDIARDDYCIPYMCTARCGTAACCQAPRAEEPRATLVSSCHCCCTTPSPAPRVPIPSETAPARVPERNEAPSYPRTRDIARDDYCIPSMCTARCGTAACQAPRAKEPPVTFVPSCHCCCTAPSPAPRVPIPSETAPARVPVLNEAPSCSCTRLQPPGFQDIADSRLENAVIKVPVLNNNRYVPRTQLRPPASQDVPGSSLDDPTGNYDVPTPAAVYMRPASAMSNGQPMYSAIHHVEHEYAPAPITKHVFHYE